MARTELTRQDRAIERLRELNAELTDEEEDLRDDQKGARAKIKLLAERLAALQSVQTTATSDLRLQLIVMSQSVEELQDVNAELVQRERGATRGS